MRLLILIVLVFAAGNLASAAPLDYKSIFGDRDACFIVSSISTGKIVEQYNAKRCKERFVPCSTFKFPLAMMAFEKGVLKDENSIVKWNGTHYDRETLNQDQTPKTWMANSANWVNVWVIPKVGISTIKSFLRSFSYGNLDFTAGSESFEHSSLKISAEEQVAFLTNFWKGSLPISKRAVDLTKRSIFVEKAGKASELYGKTGTGCIDKWCETEPGRQLGWFVGVLTTASDNYVFATNFSDLKPAKGYAGPKARELTQQILNKLNLVQ